MSKKALLPSPGSPEAQAQGCVCQPRDFEERENPHFPGWLTEGCPVHATTPEPIHPVNSLPSRLQ